MAREHRLAWWSRPETFVGLALVAWVGAKVVGGLFGVERATPMLAAGVFSLVASVLLIPQGGRPNRHVGRASLLLWVHVLGLGQAFDQSAGIWGHGPSWMAMAMLGGASTIPLALVIAQGRDQGHSARVALGVGVFLLLSMVGYNAYPSGNGFVVATTVDVAAEYANLGALLIFHLSLASLVLMVEARGLLAARAAAVLLISQMLVVLLGEFAGADGSSVSRVETLASVADWVGGIGVTLGLAMFVSGALLAWFRREPMPPASLLFGIALLPVFAFTQGPNAPDRRVDRMPFSEQNVPDWAPLRWAIEAEEPPDWLREKSPDARVPSVYVDAEGTIFVADFERAGERGVAGPREAAAAPRGAAWVSGETRVEALRPLAGHDAWAAEACGLFVDVQWLASSLSELDEPARRRFPALGLEANRTESRRVYFDRACEDDETYEIDAEAAPPLRLLLQRQTDLDLVVHGARDGVAVGSGGISAAAIRPPVVVHPLRRPSPLALRESPWSIAVGLLLGFAIAIVRMRRSGPRLGEPAPSSADAERRWPPWLRADEATDKYFVVNSEGSPYREQGKVVASASRRVVLRSLALRVLHGLGWLFTLALWAAIVGALFYGVPV